MLSVCPRCNDFNRIQSAIRRQCDADRSRPYLAVGTIRAGLHSRMVGGKVVARLLAKLDLELVFTNQDMRMLASQQRNDPGDISSYRLFEADRAIAMDFGLRKQAMD